ncbi:MAG: helix-turn-helix transcriptional regulator [Xanthobacteraceae bacterium]
MAATARQPSNVDQYVAQRIRAKRKAMGLTQSELSVKLGVTFQQMQKYEKGTNRISAGRLYRLCEIFAVDPRYFFEGLPKSGRRSH